MEEDITLIPMEPAFRQQVEDRYRVPLRDRLTRLVVTAVILFFVIVLASNRTEQGFVWTSGDGEGRGGYLMIDAIIAVAMLGMGFVVYGKLAAMNRHYLYDAHFGYIVKEKVSITKVFDTPSGINIYWLSSEEIKTFVPEPYRSFRRGDTLTIFYLKHAREYLAYE